MKVVFAAMASKNIEIYQKIDKLYWQVKQFFCKIQQILRQEQLNQAEIKQKQNSLIRYKYNYLRYRLYNYFLIAMKIEKTMNVNQDQIQSQSQSFNVSTYVKTNRKNRRKPKKIIHNCCVLIKRPDGEQQILLKQFLVSCRLKTSKCLAKKAKEVQVQKDQQVARDLLAQIKSYSNQKQITNCNQHQKQITTESFSTQKPSNTCMQTNLSPLNSGPTFFYFVPNFYNFQMV